MLRRRHFLVGGVLAGLLMNNRSVPGATATGADAFAQAADVLEQSIRSGQIKAATLISRLGGKVNQQAFGEAKLDSPFLLGSISKPICITGLMTLYDQRAFSLDDRVDKYLPEFKGDGRERVKVSHLLTHVSGLPDQVPANARLRSSHALLSEFVKEAMRVPLEFEPGTKYEYSSMAILLACEIAQRLSGKNFLELVQSAVLDPLNMTRSAIGVGRLKFDELVRLQIEHAAPEAGGGDPNAKNWDWNSEYWRKLGAPWGGVHASAGDILKFLDAFASPGGKFLSPETARLMIRNHNTQLLVPRGLGFAVGPLSLGHGVSPTAFGHTGSTGTLAWCDPETLDACVVLTSLPGQAVKPHPRELVSAAIAKASKR